MHETIYQSSKKYLMLNRRISVGEHSLDPFVYMQKRGLWLVQAIAYKLLVYRSYISFNYMCG